MEKPLRILHLEDQPDFATLVAAVLEKEGLNAEIVPVTNFTSYRTALDNDSFDIIIADYSLPTCNGIQALQVARKKCPEVPFVLLSGAIGEHAAIDILRSGATDYVLKSGLERLVPAIQRAMQETHERNQRRHAESDARQSERQYRLIFDGSPVPMWVAHLATGAFLEVNEAAIRHYGFSREEFAGLTTGEIGSPEEADKLSTYLDGVISKRPEPPGIGRAGLCRHRKKDGSFMEVDITWSIIQFQDREALLTMANDFTEVGRPAEALKKSEARLAAALRIARLGGWELELVDLENFDRNPLYWSDETYRIFGLSPGQTPSANDFFFNAIHPEDRPRTRESLARAFRNKESFEIEHRILLPDGGERVVAGRAEVVVDENGRPVRLRGIVIDITERQRPKMPAPPAAKAKSPPAVKPKSRVRSKKSSKANLRAAASPRQRAKPSKAVRKTKAARRSGR